MTFTVEEALDHYIQANEVPHVPDGTWHPSSISGCPRAAVYQIRGTPPTEVRSAQSHRTLAVGHELHRYVQAAVGTHPALARVYHEVGVQHAELNISGSADSLVLVKDGDGDSWELIEYKTISLFGFRKELPKDEHVTQVRAYLLAVRDYPWTHAGSDQDQRVWHQPLGTDLLRGRIVYVEKSDLSLSEHVVLLTPKSEDHIRQSLRSLEAHRQDGTSLPGRLPLVLRPLKKNTRLTLTKDWHCGYCPWATRCWEHDGENEQR